MSDFKFYVVLSAKYFSSNLCGITPSVSLLRECNNFSRFWEALGRQVRARQFFIRALSQLPILQFIDTRDWQYLFARADLLSKQ